MPVDPVSAAKAYHASKHAIPIISAIWNWYWARRIPKAKRNTFGIAIAISAETEDQMPQITHDFIDILKKYARDSALAKAVSVVVIPPKPSKRLVDKHSRMKMLAKTECVLLISVFARIRRTKGEEHHVLDVESELKYETVTSEVGAVVEREMRELLAHRRHISKANDLEEFEWNAASVHLAALYIMAMATILSVRADYAIMLLGELGQQLKAVPKQEQPPLVRRTLQKLRARLPRDLAIAHLQASQDLFQRWRKMRDAGLMDEFAAHLDAAGKMLPNLEFVWNGWAIHHVVKNRDIRAAREELQKFKVAKSENPFWRYSLGFTYGHMRQATTLYRAACNNLHQEMSTVLEVEEFLEWMLGEEPDKVQLHFLLGLINRHGKGDSGPAVHHFRTFLSLTDEGQFPEQREAAKRYIEQLT